MKLEEVLAHPLGGTLDACPKVLHLKMSQRRGGYILEDGNVRVWETYPSDIGSRSRDAASVAVVAMLATAVVAVVLVGSSLRRDCTFGSCPSSAF